MFDSIKNKFQFRFKDRTYAANILSAALQDYLGNEKDIAVLGIPRGGVIVSDIVATKLKASYYLDKDAKRQYPRRFKVFLDYLKLDGPIHQQDFLLTAKHNPQ